MGKYESNTGISISHETRLQSTAKLGNGRLTLLVRAGYFFLCMQGSLWMVRDSLKLSFDMTQAGALLLLAVAIALAIALLPAYWRLAGAVRWGALAGVCFLARETLAAGYLAVENCVREQLNAHYQFHLAQRAGADPQAEVFLAAAVYGALIFLLGNSVIRGGRIALLALVQLMVTALLLLCGISLESGGTLVAGGSLLLLYMMNASSGGRNSRVQRRVGIAAGLLLLVLGIAVSQFAGPAVFARIGPLNVQLFGVVRDVQQGLEGMAGNGLLGGQPATINGELGNSSVDQDGETDLMVTLQQQPSENLYLRGFVGDTYEGTYWHQADEEMFYDVFPREGEDWTVQNLLYLYLGGDSGEGLGQAAVEKVRAGGDYGFVPYGFETPANENLRGDAIYGSTDTLMEYHGYVNWSGELSQGGLPEEVFSLEAAYREYAAGEYLKVPVENLDRLKEYCRSREFGSLQEVIDFVVSSVQEGHRYSMDLEPVPEGTDFAEYFFFDQREGYCIHFATTAALMFRILGVPARYVTGYLAFASDFVQGEECWTAQVPDTQAHAWVEIYWDQVGWIPVEVTPGYTETLQNGSALMEDLLDSQEQQEAQITPALQPEQPEPTPQEAVPTEEVPQEEPDGQKDAGDGSGEADGKSGGFLWGLRMVVRIAGILLGVCGILLAAAAGIRLRRKRILISRRRRFRQKNLRAAVREISWELRRILEDGGAFLTGDDPEDARRLQKEWTGFVPGEMEEFVRIAQKAVYSREEISQEERDFCESLYHKTAKYQWHHMGKKKKFWWKYMKCHEIS